ncbi:hypothetical protein [[Clostridium] scindens]|uniref:hypothetical protein n=1 Tax=Clostridium scindens (strain JCM 10418 / VPI 12708) TaxID=29347 RepID=UPI001D06CEA0|nr:hypothetical protein [[Clostridium] scindens]MCB6288592.1 hypothetical protein [[Clostridium] scindens]MCB7194908.1 hypothetical protein [[Clostridium] scindens]MCB7288107.1 hypothetical protein [[Clostridium] scindens]MCQ5289679.1 hypothetical protein [[Clostridium] scindens]
MLVIEERDLGKLLEKKYQEGIAVGVELMEQKMLSACENGSPVEILGRAFYVRSDLQHLHDVFAELEKDR